MAMSRMLEGPQRALSVTLTKPRGLPRVHSKPGPQLWPRSHSQHKRSPTTHAETEGQVPGGRTKVTARVWRGVACCSGGRRVPSHSGEVAPLKILRAPPLQQLIVVDSATILGDGYTPGT